MRSQHPPPPTTLRTVRVVGRAAPSRASPQPPDPANLHRNRCACIALTTLLSIAGLVVGVVYAAEHLLV